jgi:uncharacterized protein related to proFAR isomerase
MASFTIIPVLDLKHGAVVRARAGDRTNYQPIVSPLAADSSPANILRGLRGLAPFRVVYIADLDAISGEGDHSEDVWRLSETAPEIELWLDGGFATLVAAKRVSRPGIVPVFGSESLAGRDALAAIFDALGPERFVLSLDYRGGTFLGPPEIERAVALWPSRLILMTLDRVGSGGGPAVAELQRLRRRADPRAVFAAGGVRNDADIAELETAGVAGALVASALHDGRLTPTTLARYCG